ncbi:MAG TPA: polysaccharide biosynthesis C-terminal domain-containing protein [Solirubrobacteraceae bacterium]|jgi:O-antigen/teichoic acid export membrane protein
MVAANSIPPNNPQPIGKRGTYRAGFAFGTLSFLAVSVTGLISTVLTARLYGVRIIGMFALITVPVAALWALSSVKEQQALIREITRLPPRHPRVTQLFAAVFTFSSTLTLAVAVLDMVVCWFVFRGPLQAPELIAPTFVSIAGRATVTNTGWNIDSILSAFVAGRQIFWVRLHEALSFIVIAMALGFVWRSVWGLVIATIGASFTALIHRMIVVRPFVKARLSWEEYRIGMRVLPELLRFGLKATPGQIAQGFSQQAGIWALGIVAPVTLVGAYSRAQNVPQRLQQATNRITEVLYPTLVGRHTAGDGDGFDRALIDSIRYEMVGMLLIAAVIGGAANSVLEIFGPGFSRAAPALALLMLFPALASVTATQTQALWATNQPGRTSVIAIIRLTVTIALLVVLTPKIDIIGPAIALLAGYLLVIALSGLALRVFMARPLRATWPLRERFALVAAYVAGFAAAHGVEQMVSSAVIGLLPCLFAGTLAYVAVLVACGGVNSRDRHRLTQALDMGRSWRERRALARRPTVPLGER